MRWRELSADIMLMKAKDQTGFILASPVLERQRKSGRATGCGDAPLAHRARKRDLNRSAETPQYLTDN